jgi:hypothetical protein
MPRNPFKWVFTDLTEASRPINPKITEGLNGVISLAPRYIGRGAHDPARWDAIISVPVANGEAREIRYSYDVTTIETSDENIWRRCWARAKAHIDWKLRNGEIASMIRESVG